MTTSDPACDTAHGDLPPDHGPRTLVAVFESPVAEHLIRFAADLGYRTVLVEPQPRLLAGTPKPHGDQTVASVTAAGVDEHSDVVVTDHDRPELGALLRDALDSKARWIGVMGAKRHSAPHIEALKQLGVDEAEIARVHRPIGLNIGSRTPAEIAIATLAGLIADRNGRPGGFAF
ncbi:XdhC family protein [Phytohabitans houttuyneae]|uniref:Xanthine dehydrogenase accessory factor n=1 Tax=Phytohabitans houttuyneae TaxID=1076126 RepID=A0A6V8KJH5_9ACTN|nr:XdhC family protein [Phytohabitans houttuyneae]GFJ85342.1 xanthine dehydrogenase accessory factor [Phytohabitans houttuyneae]